MLDLDIDLTSPSLPRAACRDVDPEAFFPIRHGRTDRARKICLRCPEIRACLRWAIEHDEQGIWAATTEEERAELRARHERTAS